MELSDDGCRFIARHEGIRLKVYPDTAGKPTIGIGHLIRPGEDFSAGITEAQAFDLFRADAAEAVAAVNRLVTVPLNQHQFDSLVDFTFNEGQIHLARSTLLRCLNAGHYEAAKAQMDEWVFSGGKKTAGLVTRRDDDQALFDLPVQDESPPPIA